MAWRLSQNLSGTLTASLALKSKIWLLTRSIDWWVKILFHQKKTSSEIRQKGESQNECYKKPKQIKFSKKRAFLTPWYAYARVRIRDKRSSFSGKFSVICFLVIPVLKFALLRYYRRLVTQKFKSTLEMEDSWKITHITFTAQKMKFSIKDFFSKCDQIRSFLRIWSHLLKKFLTENFTFCAVFIKIIGSSLGYAEATVDKCSAVLNSCSEKFSNSQGRNSNQVFFK